MSLMRAQLIGLASCGVLSLVALSGQARALTVEFTLSPPGVQQSALQGQLGTATENFDSLPLGPLQTPGTLSVGSYLPSGNVFVAAADQYGGAGGVGRGMVVEGVAGNLSVTISPSKYVGFWWSAGDETNFLDIYGGVNGTTLLGTFSSQDLVNSLAGNSVLATDNNVYSGDLYLSNPTSNFNGLNSGQSYAYVNLRLSDPSASFTALRFRAGLDRGFEFDNLTISPNYYDPTSVPGPLPVLGGAAAYGWSRRLRRRIQLGRRGQSVRDANG